MEKYELGYLKESFSINYHQGEIWCEHLDSLEDKKELVLEKFKSDLQQIKKPSTSSFIIINLDETEVDEDIMNVIISSLRDVQKPLGKIVFVGLNRKYRMYIKRVQKELSFMVYCMDDFEKAKESLFVV